MIPYPTLLKIIEGFYEYAKADVMIGYHFRFIEDFDTHIPKIADFWNLQVNGVMENRSHLPFHLIEKHKALGIKSAEVGRWMVLFEKNLNEQVSQNIVSKEQAEELMTKVNHFKDKLMEFFFKNN